MQKYDESDIVNIGVGEDVSIAELYALVKKVAGFSGSIQYDNSKPDGTPRKLLDVSKIQALGWKARILLEEGVRSTVAWYEEQGPAAKRSVPVS